MRMCPPNSRTAVGLPDVDMSFTQIHHPAIQKLALTFIVSALVIVVFGTSFGSMWDLWQTSDHRHGLLVFPISMFLIWRLRFQLTEIASGADARGLLLIVPLALLWLVARFSGVQVAEHLAVLAMIPATIVALAGPGIAAKMAFPLLFLLLATPIGESLVPYLMLITADLSALFLQLSGIPLLRDGQYMSLPGGEFVVADVCSGLRYLLTGVMIALLYGYLTFTGIRKRLLFVAATAVILVIANSVRAYVVMAVASATNMEVFGGRDHVYFGWLMFGVVIMLVMWLGARFADEEMPQHVESSGVLATAQSPLPVIVALGLMMLAVTIMPLIADFGEAGAMLAAVAATALFAIALFVMQRSDSFSHGKTDDSRALNFHLGGRGTVIVVITLAVLIATPRIASTIESGVSDAVHVVDLEAVLPCNTVGLWGNAWKPRFEDPDFEVAATVSCDGEPVSVYVAAYASALQSNELISSTHYVAPPQWDRVSKSRVFKVQDRTGSDRNVVEIELNLPSKPSLIWYWYEVGNNIRVTPLATKADQLLALIKGRPAGGRVVVIETGRDVDLHKARERLRSVATAVFGAGVYVSPAKQD